MEDTHDELLEQYDQLRENIEQSSIIISQEGLSEVDVGFSCIYE